MRLDHRWLGMAIVLALVSTLGGCSCGKKASPEESSCDPRFVSASGACDAGAIDGTVRLTPGDGSHAGVRVRLGDGPREAVTASDGRFWFDGVEAGDHTLLLVHPSGSVTGVDVHVHAGEVAQVGPVALDRVVRARVEGRILLGGADEHAGTMVTVVGGPEVALTRPDGSFSFPPLAAGDHTLRAQHSGYVAADLPIVVAGDTVTLGAVTLAAVPAGGTIAGRVTIAGSDAAAANATVIVAGVEMSARTGGDGAFEITNVRPGTWEVRAGLPGFGPAVATGVVVESGRVTELSLVVARGGDDTWVAGRARRLGEANHTGIEVMLTSGDDTFSATTGADGRWEISGLPEGLYDLHASVEGLEPEVVRGVAVGAGPNAAPDVDLGSAVSIADRFPSWSVVLPKTRRAVFQTHDDDDGPAVWRFDLATRESSLLTETALFAYGFDEQERYMTVALEDDWRTLHRLTIADGAIEPVTPGGLWNYWTWPGITFLETQDGEFYALRPEAVEGEPIELGCELSYIGTESWLGDAEDDWRVMLRFQTQCGGALFSLADLESGFVGFPGDWFFGASKTRGVSIRLGRTPPVLFAGEGVGVSASNGATEAWWVDVDARDTFKLSDSIGSLFGDLPLGILAYSEWMEDGLHPLKRVDLATGATTLVAADANEYIQAGPRLVLARPHDPADPLLWYAIDGAEQGVVCDDEDVWDLDEESGTIACFGADRNLFVFDPLTRTRTLLDTDPRWIDAVGPRFVMWTSSDDRQHLRHLDNPTTIEWDSLPWSQLTGTRIPNFWILSSEGTGTQVIDLTSGAFAQIRPAGEAPPDRCEVSASMSTAVCVESCGSLTCGTVYDLASGTSVSLGTTSWTDMPISWAPDEDSVAFGGGFFAVRENGTWAGASCEFPYDPLVAHAVVRGSASLWQLWDDSLWLCTAAGQAISAGYHTYWRFEPTPIPGESLVVTPEGVADLEAGWFMPSDPYLWSLHLLPEGAFATSDHNDFMAIGPAGAVKIADDFSDLIRLGGANYLLTQGDGGRTLWSMRDGTITPIAENVDWVEEVDDDKAILFGWPNTFDGTKLSYLTLSTGGIETVAVASGFDSVWGDGAGTIYFESAQGFALMSLSTKTGVLTTLAEDAEILDMDAVGRLYFGADGIIWMNDEAGIHGIIRAEEAWLSDSREDVVILAREAPDATFWYEAR